MMESKTITSSYKGYQVDLKQTCNGKDCKYTFKISHDKYPTTITSNRLYENKLECTERIIAVIDELMENRIEKAL